MLGNRWPHKPPLGYGIDFGHPLTRGLIAGWLENEGTGGALWDISGNRRTATIAGATWTTGKFGAALAFNGTSNYASAALSSGLSGDHTLAAWLRPTSNANTCFALESDTGSNYWSGLLIVAQNFAFGINDGTHTPGVQSIANAPLNKWTHVVGVRNAGVVKLYINGVLQGSATDTTTVVPAYSGLYVGTQGSNLGRCFPGAVDLPLVYNRALSAAEVQQLYAQPFCFVARRTQTYYLPLASIISPAGIRRIAAEPPPPDLGAVIAIPQSSPAPLVATRIAPAASESRQPESGTILAGLGPSAAIPRFDGPPVVAPAWAESPRPESGVVLTRYAPTRAGRVPIPPGRMAKTEAPTPDPGSVLSTADHLPAVPPFNAHVSAIIIAAEPQPTYPGSVLDCRRSALLVGSGYHIYSNSGSGDAISYATPVATASLSATTWTSTGLAAPGAWMFGVRAFNFNGEEENLDCAVTIVLDASGNDITNRPLPPSGLRAFATPNGSIRVEWNYLSTRGLASPIGFNVYLGTGGTPNYATPAATVRYSAGLFNVFVTNIAGLSDGTTYTVGVRARNGSGEEQNTITVSVTADAIGPAAVDSLFATAIV